MTDNTYYLNMAKNVLMEIKKSVVGKVEVICKIMMAILARGHVLIEDIPGVGKTTMALAFAETLGLKCNRVQFTPDVMPSDIVGFNMYNRATNKFEYKAGAADCNILLADEINRTSPKTQSALLQVMEEGKVSVDGVTYALPEPFMVIATQNPFGSVGTQKLPESQMDRFMITMSIGYPDFDSEMDMAMSIGKKGRAESVVPVITAEDIGHMQDEIYEVYMNKSIYKYIVDLVTATRNSPYIERGASPRATIALVKMSKAWAWLNGRDYVIPSDVSTQFEYVISHRVGMGMSARMEKLTKQDVIKGVMKSVKRPTVGEKA